LPDFARDGSAVVGHEVDELVAAIDVAQQSVSDHKGRSQKNQELVRGSVYHPMTVERILAKALGQDVAQLATAEKQLLLARLLGRLAHEIRNPLSSLDIHVQLLEEDLAYLAPQLKEKTACRFEIIHGELHRLENIMKHFLRLAGPSELDVEQVQMDKVIGHVCELLRPEAATRGIEITMQVAEKLPAVTADPGQLTQALVNLVINSIQAVEHEGRIDVSANLGPQDGFLRIEVRDNGPGVPPEKLATIFEPFFTTKPEGSGLGLWIVQQIAMAHGGGIQASNAPAGGAVFTLHLPLQTKRRPNG
jgi:two-component system, NtrC family, sensor histidine kinase HydH